MRRDDSRWMYPATAFAVLFIFLSLFSGKRGDYLLPLYPMGALIVAHYFSESVSRTRLRLPLGQSIPSGILAGLIGLFALILFVPVWITIDPDVHFGFLNARDQFAAKLLLLHHLPSQWILVLGTVVMLFFAARIVLSLRKRSALETWGLITAWTFLVLFLVHGPLAKVVNRYSSLKPFAGQVRESVASSPLEHYGETVEDLLYYLDRPVREVHGEEGIRRVIERPETVLLVKGSQSGPLLARYPNFRVVLETKELFRHYQLLGTASVPAKP